MRPLREAAQGRSQPGFKDIRAPNALLILFQGHSCKNPNCYTSVHSYCAEVRFFTRTVLSLCWLQGFTILSYELMKHCQDEFRNLSGCVIKILTACNLGAKLNLRSIAFQRCMAIGGRGRFYPVEVVKIGQIKVSVQELGENEGFIWTEIWIISLQSGLGPKILKLRVKSFKMSFGHLW